MVGDSYFTTHLCRDSTRLTGAEEQAMGLSALVKQVAEVRAAMDALLPDARMPYLMADLPDGTLETPDAALRAAQRFADAGADVVKLEIAEPGLVRCLDRVAGHGVPVAAHLGYTRSAGRQGVRATPWPRPCGCSRRHATHATPGPARWYWSW